MKKLLGILFVLFILGISCKKEDNRRPGVCYCEFVKGADQEYDLNHLSRQEQIDQCNTHDRNASNFGGSCKLK